MNDSPTDSPCIGVCKIDPTSYRCEGCNRTLEEIENAGKQQQERIKNNGTTKSISELYTSK